MKKSILLGAILVCGLGLAGCGSQSKNNQASSSSSNQSEKVSKNSSSASVSSSSKGVSPRSNSTSTTSSSTSNTPTTAVNNKQAGVMLALLVDPDWFKEYIGDNVMSYKSSADSEIDSPQVRGYDYITANGDPTSYIYYKVDGNTVNYKQWVPADGDGGVANGHFESGSVSLSRLENDYYVNQGQKDEVNQYVSELKE